MTRTSRLVLLRFLASFAFACTVGMSPQARAGSADVTRAAELKKQGDAAIESGRPAEALAAYEQAYELAKDAALLYNKGRARMALADYPGALEELEAFDREASPELKTRVRRLPHMLEELRGKVTRLTIVCGNAATVRLRDRTVGTCPLPASPLIVNAGPAVIEVRADGYVPWRREVDLPGGGIATFDVTLVPKQVAPTPPPPQADTSSGSVFSRWWFWAGLGVAVVAGGAVVVAVATEREPREGTVAPGVVSAGLRGPGFSF